MKQRGKPHQGLRNLSRSISTALCALGLMFGAHGSAYAESKITFNLKDADIQTVISTVSEFTGKNFIVDPRVKGKATVISSQPMGKEEVYYTFLSLLEVHNFAAIPSGNLIKILPDVNAKQGNTPVANDRNPGQGDEMVTRVIAIENVNAAQLVPILRPLVPQQGHLAAYANSNVLILSDRATNVARLMKIIDRVDIASSNDIEVYPLKHASAAEVVRILESLRRQKKDKDPNAASTLVADDRTNSILISGDKSERLHIRALVSHLDTPLESTGNTKVIYLRYAQAKDLVPVLTGLGESINKEKQGGGKGAKSPTAASLNIQAHESTNALVINGPPDVIRSLENVISKLDIRRAQVLIEAVIAEISQNRLAELGVQWLADGTPGGNGPVGGISFGSNNILGIAGAAMTGQVPSINPGAFLGLGKFNSDNVNFGMMVSALEGDGDTNILSKPNIVTLDNEEAEIVVGQNVPFITGSYSSTGTSGSSPGNPFQTIKRENIGITLKVKPQINEGDAIKLDIEQKVDDVAGGVSGAADLVTNTRSIKTTVLVDDGGALALGGLIKDNLIETEQKVPLLGDIPVLGALFRYRNTQKQKTNMMVFMRPIIMRDAAITTRITGSKYNFMRAEQMAVHDRGVALMEDSVAPIMPSFEEFLELPPPFEPAPTDSDPSTPAQP